MMIIITVVVVVASIIIFIINFVVITLNQPVQNFFQIYLQKIFGFASFVNSIF